MAWDSNKAIDYFMELYRRHNPEQYKGKPAEPHFSDMHDVELALQRVYADCTSAAWTREGLLKALESLIQNERVDYRANDAAKYEETVRKKATELKKQIESGVLAF